MSNRVIAIAGFMAAGKTAVGRELAKRLGRAFIDLDEEIVKREGRPISEIIAVDGEAGFRSIETSVLEEALQTPNPCVVALGGGTWTIDENRALLQSGDADVVWLDVPFELCWTRINATGGRPLAPSRATAERLYRDRQPFYQLANHRVEIDESMTVTDSAGAISSLFQPETPR